jgi:MFS family permease
MGLAPSVPALVVALFLMGVMNGFVQVSMNAQAVALEQRYRRTILSTMHGGFSIGMMGGALVAALAAWLGVSYHVNLTLVSALLFCVAIAIGYFLLDAGQTALAHHRRMHFSLALAVLIVVAFFELFCEGAATAWSAVYTHDVGASSAIAATAFGLYSLTMTAGRLRGDRIVLRLGVGGVVALGALIAAAGMALTIAVPTQAFALAGFALYGLGLSCLAPTLFRAAGQLPLPEGQGIAVVLGAAWPAFLLVGPLIGGIADATSLRFALLVPLASTLVMLALSGVLGRVAPAPAGMNELESAL